MRRTEVLQEPREMRFEEAYSNWTEKRLSQDEAARLLGVCSRTFRRYVDRYGEAGLEGLLDKHLTQPSSRRAPVDEVFALTQINLKRLVPASLPTATRLLMPCLFDRAQLSDRALLGTPDKELDFWGKARKSLFSHHLICILP